MEETHGGRLGWGYAILGRGPYALALSLSAALFSKPLAPFSATLGVPRPACVKADSQEPDLIALRIQLARPTLGPRGKFRPSSTEAVAARKRRPPFDFERDQVDAGSRADLGADVFGNSVATAVFPNMTRRPDDLRGDRTGARRNGMARVRHSGLRDRLSLPIFGR